ncbi:SpoIIE family protein phosphatase, partial [Oleiphilus sp. HI0043]|uniref:SpoIIE family protein phosphatase n=2 Tax=Oleiphilus TaxID=141450 RepID=UPI000A905ADE
AERFNSEIELHELRYGDKLFMFTDGILEGSPTDSDEMFGEERVMDSLDRRVKEGGQERVFDGLLDDYHSFSQGSAQQDDISLVEITAGPIDNSSVIDLEPKTNLPWSVNVDLDAERIHSQPDPIVQVIKVLPADLFLYRRADMIRTILSELYSNSLEHGLLALDSTIKGSHDGFTKYYQQRQERMDALDAGRISISVSFDYERSGSELKISL